MPYHRFIQANLDRLLDSPEKALLRVTKAKRRAQTFAKRSGRWVKRRWLLRSTSQFKASTSRSQALVPTSRGSDPTDLLTAEDRGSRFVLYRIIGNDLYPRHNEGQSLANLRFILEHESQFEGCEKRWLLNRIRDQSKLQGLIEVLESYGYGYDVIPFELEAFKAALWDWNVLPSPDYFVSKAYLRLNRSQREGFEVALYRNKNNYLMNNNGARNKALDLGRARADWVLPWDGNCFLTASGWESLQSAVLRQSSADYFHVPMLRVSDNSQLLDPLLDAQPRDEPQLVFAASASERFNEDFPYGRRPKVEMFWRLGLQGPWDAWMDEVWDQPRRPSLEPTPPCPRAGWVARLHSGVSDSKSTAAVLSQQSRYSARNAAIKISINQALLSAGNLNSRSAYQSYWSSPLLDDSQCQWLQYQAGASEKLLLAWQHWWDQGGPPPKASTEEVISAYCHLLWSHIILKPDQIPRATCLLDQLVGLWFAEGKQGLQPRLRLLRRRLFSGRLPGTSPSASVVLQLALLSDLLSWCECQDMKSPISPESIGLFKGWTEQFMNHLPNVIGHPWVTARPEDQQDLYIVELLLRQHTGCSTELIDLLLRLGCQYRIARSTGGETESRIANLHGLMLKYADQYGVHIPDAEHLDKTSSSELFPPLLPIPAFYFQ